MSTWHWKCLHLSKRFSIENLAQLEITWKWRQNLEHQLLALLNTLSRSRMLSLWSSWCSCDFSTVYKYQVSCLVSFLPAKFLDYFYNDFIICMRFKVLYMYTVRTHTSQSLTLMQNCDVVQSQCQCVCALCHRACGRNLTYLTTCRQPQSTQSYLRSSPVKATTSQVAYNHRVMCMQIRAF